MVNALKKCVGKSPSISGLWDVGVSLSGITNGVSATVGFSCSKPEF